MASTILVAGATGNTGQGVIKTLSELLKTTTNFSGHRILALTRSSRGATARQLAELPNVEVVEKNWADITPDWLRYNNVVRAFIALHVNPNQFAEESLFHLAALTAGVQYIIQISTTAANTSLQPNIFSQFYLSPAAELIKIFRKTGKQDTLRLMASEDAPVGIIDSNDVGVFATHLLAADDIIPHNKAKYVLNGPEDITGRQIVNMIEEYISTKVEDVRLQDLSFIDHQAAQNQESKNLILSVKYAPKTAWEGKCRATTMSKEALQLAAPKRMPAEVLKIMVEE